MLARAIATAGHTAVLSSLALPWVGGQFGSRATLSPFQFDALVDRLTPSLAGAEAVFAWVVPFVALQAALTWPVGALFRLPAASVRTLECALTGMITMAAVAVGVGATVAMQTGDLVAGPRLGALVAMIGSACVLLLGQPRARRRPVRVSERERSVIQTRISR